MVFRKENKVDAFQRQISALRQQLGTPEDELDDRGDDRGEEYAAPSGSRESAYGGTTPAESAMSPYDGYDSGVLMPPDIESPVAPSLPMPRVADEQTSVIAHDTTWKGDLQTNGSLHLHGRVEGSLTAKEDIFVAEEADVDATIEARNVIIAGTVRGTIRCGERFEALPQGRVMSDITSPTLVIHEGSIINGQVRMGGSEATTDTDTRPVRPSVIQRRAARGGR